MRALGPLRAAVAATGIVSALLNNSLDLAARASRAAPLQEMAARVFAMVERGTLKVTIGQRFPLAAAAAAHDALEARRTFGSVVLLA